jgi:hypothetical protein
MGLAKLPACHPEAVSFVNVIDPNKVPEVVQSFPTWGPVLPLDL